MMKRILVMDGSLVWSEVTRAALVNAGYEVVCARDLADARARGPSDLVLAAEDIAMTLRHDEIGAPIYLLSSLDEAALAERARSAHVDGFIQKQLGLPAIVNRVRAIVPLEP